MDTAIVGKEAPELNRETQLRRARVLVHAIMAQAYGDVRQYWKYLSDSVQKNCQQTEQEKCLRGEYETSLDFFIKPYGLHGSYMEHLLFLTGEGNISFAGVVESVLRLKKEVDAMTADRQNSDHSAAVPAAVRRASRRVLPPIMGGATPPNYQGDQPSLR